MLDAFAVHFDRVAPGVAAAIAPRVHQDREQPRPQIRARLEPGRGAERLDERVLDEVVGFHGASRQPQGGTVQGVELSERGALEIVRPDGTDVEESEARAWRRGAIR